MNLDLTGKRALVCGSTQGIGKAAAVELALLGASVTLIARNEIKLKQVLQDLPTTKSQKHEFVVADFSNPDQLKANVSKYIEGKFVHVLVNNSGGPPGGPILDATIGEFENAYKMHLICNHLLVQLVAPGMKAERFGRIINVISTSIKAPIKNLGVSNTTRNAVANWAKTLSFELAEYNITVNNVLPGASMTARLEEVMRVKASSSGKPYEQVMEETAREVPAGRISDPSEVAAAIAFLATPAAAYINGINLPVDGGRTPAL